MGGEHVVEQGGTCPESLLEDGILVTLRQAEKISCQQGQADLRGPDPLRIS